MESCGRPEPPLSSTEKEMLLGFLDFLRGTIVCKLDGLSEAQARQTHPPSTMSLIAIAQHLTYVERYWFRQIFNGEDIEAPWTEADPDADWRISGDTTVANVISGYREERTLCDQIVDAASLDDHARGDRSPDSPRQLRWILTHMIEETARHCGHADLIRESIDGQTGE